jgi:signal transduction histidine kinase
MGLLREGGWMSEGRTQPDVLLATLPPTLAQRRLALGMVLALLCAFVMMLPFARIELPAVDSFVPTIQMALLINDLATSALLFAQFSIVRQRAILVLASGYLFTALIVVPHALTFPGAFAPAGLLGAGPQSSAWLYIFWHTGLPVAVMLYVWLKEADPGVSFARTGAGAHILASAVFVIALVAALTWLATSGADLLPRLLPDATRVTLWGQVVTGLLVLLAVVALALLWLRRRSVLDLWLIVMLCAYLPEVAITAFLGAARFSLGYYVARLFALTTASIVLVVLLSQTTALYTRLARSIVIQRRERDARAIAMEAVTGSIAHEVKQPLAAIVANATAGLRWLELARPDLDEAREALKEIIRVGIQADKIIESTRSIFRKDAARRAPLDINELIRDTVGLEKGDLESRRVSLELQLAASLPLVDADRVQLQQVLLNLITNAIDAMDARPNTQHVLTLRSELAQSGDVLVSLEDSGAGVAPNDIDRIFNAFYTTKSQGTGMGLAICRLIIEAHEGRIWATPGVRGGTALRFMLPASGG